MFDSANGCIANHANLRGAGPRLDEFDGTLISRIGRSCFNTFQNTVLCPAWVSSDWRSIGSRLPRDAHADLQIRGNEQAFVPPNASAPLFRNVLFEWPAGRSSHWRCAVSLPVVSLPHGFRSHNTVVSVLHSMLFHSPLLECGSCPAVVSTVGWPPSVPSC